MRNRIATVMVRPARLPDLPGLAPEGRRVHALACGFQDVPDSLVPVWRLPDAAVEPTAPILVWVSRPLVYAGQGEMIAVSFMAIAAISEGIAVGAGGGKMDLVNTDQLVLIGPGSEWFWAAAQLVVVTITLVAIYRQLRAQAAANFVQRIETINSRWESPRMAQARLVAALHLRYEAHDRICYMKAMPILDFFTDVQNLANRGYIPVGEVAANFGRSIQEWVTFTSPLIRARRTETGNPWIYDLEGLVDKVCAWERAHGVAPMPTDPGAQAKLLDEAIVGATARLQQEAAWRTGEIPGIPERLGARAHDEPT